MQNDLNCFTFSHVLFIHRQLLTSCIYSGRSTPVQFFAAAQSAQKTVLCDALPGSEQLLFISDFLHDQCIMSIQIISGFNTCLLIACFLVEANCRCIGDINVQILDEAIEITIMGDRGAVNRVKPENISVVIDYSSYTESTGTINASANVYFDVDEAHGIVYELGYYEVMVQPE